MVASTPSGSPRSASKSRYCCGSRPAVRATASPSRTNYRMRWRNSASSWYSAVVISFAIEQLYRNTIYVSTPLSAMIQGSYWRSRSSALKRFAKRFLCFVVLVAVAFVELVCALANHVRAYGHPLAAMFARPIFRGGQQQRACSQAALAFRDNQAIYFRPDFRFEKGLLAHVRPADHSIFRRVRHEYRMLRCGLDSRQPLAHLRRRRRISELAGKHRDSRRVGAFRSPDVDRKSTRLNSSHSQISYAVFCLKKKTKIRTSIYDYIVSAWPGVQADISTPTARILHIAALSVRPILTSNHASSSVRQPMV